MKKIIFSFVVLSTIMACGGNDSKKEESKKEETVADVSQNPEYKKGLALIAKSDCLTCHKVDETLTGPPYREVANKYAGMPDTIIGHLAGKIITGGSGVWGTTFMTPHPGMPKEDAEAMVKYILMLKNK